MRHDLAAGPIPECPGSMGEAAPAAPLIAFAGLPLSLATRPSRTTAAAVDLAPVAAATQHDLRATQSAQEHPACLGHRRSGHKPKRDGRRAKRVQYSSSHSCVLRRSVWVRRRVKRPGSDRRRACFASAPPIIRSTKPAADPSRLALAQPRQALRPRPSRPTPLPRQSRRRRTTTIETARQGLYYEPRHISADSRSHQHPGAMAREVRLKAYLPA